MADDSEDVELQHRLGERLRDRLTLSVINIAEDQAKQRNCVISPTVMAAVADLTFKYAEQLGRDLEMFAQHAGRKIINVDDVILAAHRNEDLSSTVRALSKQISKTKDPPPDRKRKKSVQQNVTVNID